MRALLCLAAAGLAAAGCARLPDHIAASYVAEGYYQDMSCAQLATAHSNFQREQRLAASQQSRFVGVLFPSSEYKRNSQRIAESKGELAAIGRVWTMKGCARALPGAATAPADPAMPGAAAGAAADPAPNAAAGAAAGAQGPRAAGEALR